MNKRIAHIEWPPVALAYLKSISTGWPQYSKIDQHNKITLHGLSSQQHIALTLFFLISEVDEIFDNLNLVIGDMEQLRTDERAFGDNRPFLRYQLLIRTYLYEYARFEDVFGYFTLWCKKKELIDDETSKSLGSGFGNLLFNTPKHQFVDALAEDMPQGDVHFRTIKGRP